MRGEHVAFAREVARLSSSISPPRSRLLLPHVGGYSVRSNRGCVRNPRGGSLPGKTRATLFGIEVTYRTIRRCRSSEISPTISSISLQRNQSQRRAAVVDDDGHVDLVRLEIGQQVVDLFARGRNRASCTTNCCHTKSLPLLMKLAGSDVERAADVVDIPVDRNARKARFEDRLDRLVVVLVVASSAVMSNNGVS